jgi:ParB family chromosome partitioning protein
MLMAGEITEAHGKILAGLPLEKQYFFAQRCIEKRLSMRDLSKEIKLVSEKNRKSPIENNQKDKKDLDISRLEREVSDRFGHEVKFSLEKNKSGYVNIRFFNLDELDAILEKIQKNALTS